LCTQYAFEYQRADGEVMLLCEECAAGQGLSAGGTCFNDGVATLVPASRDQLVEMRSEQIVSEVRAARSCAGVGQLDGTPSDINNLLEMRGNKMVARHVRRIDTGEVFRTCAAAAESVGGKMTGLYAAMQHARAYRGVQFEYTDDPVTAGTGVSQVSMVGSGRPEYEHHSMGLVRSEVSGVSEGDIVSAITRLFEKLSSVATGMQVLKMTDLKISAGGMTVEAGTLEICGPGR